MEALSDRVSHCVSVALPLSTDTIPVFKEQTATNQITFQTGRLTTADRLVKVRQGANATHQCFHLSLGT